VHLYYLSFSGGGQSLTYSGWWTKASGLMTLYPLRPRALKTRAATLASDLTINPSCYRRDASLESDLIASRFVDLGLCQRKRAYFTQRNARAAHPQTEPFMLKGEKSEFQEGRATESHFVQLKAVYATFL